MLTFLTGFWYFLKNLYKGSSKKYTETTTPHFRFKDTTASCFGNFLSNSGLKNFRRKIQIRDSGSMAEVSTTACQASSKWLVGNHSTADQCHWRRSCALSGFSSLTNSRAVFLVLLSFQLQLAVSSLLLKQGLRRQAEY